jgi:hypothetical protein
MTACPDFRTVANLAAAVLLDTQGVDVLDYKCVAVLRARGVLRGGCRTRWSKEPVSRRPCCSLRAFLFPTSHSLSLSTPSYLSSSQAQQAQAIYIMPPKPAPAHKNKPLITSFPAPLPCPPLATRPQARDLHHAALPGGLPGRARPRADRARRAGRHQHLAALRLLEAARGAAPAGGPGFLRCWIGGFCLT